MVFRRRCQIEAQSRKRLMTYKTPSISTIEFTPLELTNEDYYAKHLARAEEKVTAASESKLKPFLELSVR